VFSKPFGTGIRVTSFHFRKYASDHAAFFFRHSAQRFLVAWLSFRLVAVE
jgi:hypothetical protein